MNVAMELECSRLGDREGRSLFWAHALAERTIVGRDGVRISVLIGDGYRAYLDRN